MRICIVDDVEENARYMQRVLSDYQTVVFTDPLGALDFLSKRGTDILLTDQKMPGLSGTELVRAAGNGNSDFLSIVVSAYTDADDLVDAVNSNVIHKFIVKPFSPSVLLQYVQRGVEHLRLLRMNRTLQQQLAEHHASLMGENQRLRNGAVRPMDIFMSVDPAMDRAKVLLRNVASADGAVLITGETGTGKELAARAVHLLSARRDRPFVAINCAAFPESMLESELFGHRSGAFTGAAREKPGLLETADGGTVFLDEIGEMPTQLQAKILRTIQFGTYFPLGATEERRFSARIVSSTNRDLRRGIREGWFREDLFYRLNTLHVHLPPLRQRKKDIVPILRVLAERRGVPHLALSDEAEEMLLAQRFPGNVRELSAVLERLLLVTHFMERVQEVGTQDLSEAMSDSSAAEANDMEAVASPVWSVPLPAPGTELDLAATLADAERALIGHVFRQEGGNISRSAARLMLSRQGMKNKLLRYGCRDCE